MGEFGQKFRREREKKGISLEEVSNATKISSRMLLAIEDEQFDRLPGGVFNKGFIRAYAKQIGLNEDQAVADYVACLHQSQLDSQEIWDTRSSPGADRHDTPSEDEELPGLQLPRAEHVSPPRHLYGLRSERTTPWRLPAVALLVIVLAVLLWRRHSHNGKTELVAPAPTSTSQPAAQPSLPPAPAANVPAPALHAASAPASTRPSAAKNATISSTSATNSAPAKPAVVSEPNAAANTVGDLASQPDQSPTPASSVAAPLNLIIRASENSWISVTADGRSVLHELLIAPAHTSIHASREITVKLGNAGGVNFVWNGHELPAQGAEAEVKTLVFDDTGMRDVTPPPSPAPPPNQ